MKKQIENLKSQKQFKIADVIVYALIVVLIIGLFFAFFNKSGSKFAGVDAYYDGKKIMSYRFNDDSIVIDSDWQEKIIVSREDKIIKIKFTFGDKYNVLQIDTSKKQAKVTQANCSYHKECVKSFPAINSADGFSICIPHKLQIIGVGTLDGEIVVG